MFFFIENKLPMTMEIFLNKNIHIQHVQSITSLTVKCVQMESAFKEFLNIRINMALNNYALRE